MSIELGRLLIESGAVSPAEVEAALFLSTVRGIPFPRALVDRGAISERALEAELDRRGGLALRQVLGSRELFARLPRALCRRLGAVPTRLDPATGTIDVAVADPLDRHLPAELGFHLGQPVRVLRAPMAAIEEAIRALELEERQAQPQHQHPLPQRARPRRVTPPSPHGAPQSTIPPPPEEDVPIPLVRRAPLLAEPPPPPARRVPTIAPPVGMAAPPSDRDVPLPLRQLKPERRSDGGRDAHFGGEPRVGGESRGEPRVGGEPRGEPRLGPASAAPATLRGPGRSSAAASTEPTPPAISFPSSPPGPLTDPDGLAPAADARLYPMDAAAFRAPPPPAFGDAEPATLRHGRAHTARPEIHIDIPPPRGERWHEGGFEAPDPEETARAGADDAPSGATFPPAPPQGLVGSSGEDTLPPTFVDLTDMLDVMYAARSRDEIVSLTLRGLRMLARRVALFSVRRGAFQGYSCSPEFGDGEALRAVSIPVNLPSLLATAMATGVYLGPVPNTPAHADLLRVMLDPSPDVAAVAVRVAGRPVLVMVADQLGDTLNGTRTMDELARAVGDALTRILTARV